MTRNSTPQAPATEAVCSTTGTPTCEPARVPLIPVGFTKAATYSRVTQTAGTENAASSGRPRRSQIRNSHAPSVKATSDCR